MVAMNYGKIHDALIKKAWNRRLAHGEWHHVLPNCMGGKGSEQVCLTLREHFVVHQLLSKMYPANQRLVYAANMMAGRVGGGRDYARIRQRVAEIMIGNKRGLGRKVSANERARTSMFHRGNRWGCGKICSKETRDKISKSNKGRVFTDEHRKKLSLARIGVSPANKGVPCPQHVRDKISESLKGRVMSEETRRKLAISLRGRRPGFLGHKHTEESRRRIADKLRGISRSEETKRRMSAAQVGNKHALGLIRGPMSEEHKRKIADSRRRNINHNKEKNEKVSS